MPHLLLIISLALFFANFLTAKERNYESAPKSQVFEVAEQATDAETQFTYLMDFDAQVRRDKAAQVLQAVWLYDDDDECRQLVDNSPEYSVYKAESLRKKDSALFCFGADYARAVAPQYAEEPLRLVEATLEAMPEARRAVYRGEFDRLMLSGKDTRQDYYALYARMVRDDVRARYEEQKKLISAVASSLENSTSILPWRDYLDLVKKQESQYKRQLSEYQKYKIYNQWSKKIKDAQYQKQVETEAYQKKRKETVYIIVGSIFGSALIVFIIQVSYKKRAIIYRYIRPLVRPFPLTICILLAIALFKLPYGYYQFLRIAVTTWALLALIQANNRHGESPGKTYTLLLTGGIAILYNPVLPIHLDKDHWTILNLITLPLILLSTYLNGKKK